MNDLCLMNTFLGMVLFDVSKHWVSH